MVVIRGEQSDRRDVFFGPRLTVNDMIRYICIRIMVLLYFRMILP
jgi:hypothetical protein